MPLLVDLTAAFVGAVLAYLVVRWAAMSPETPARPAQEAARAAGEAVRQHSRLRRFVVRRLDRTVASGFVLTLALRVTLVGGVVLGVLAVLFRRVGFIQRVDNSVAAWGFDHRSPVSTDGLHAVTDLAAFQTVILLALLLAVYELYRTRNRWAFVYLLVVLAGTELVMHTVKDIVHRVRPTLDPAAAHLGPSFPSGHSATAAAFYAAAGLILGRGRSRDMRLVVAAAAVGVAIAVALSRVLLDLHWLSDVIGGLSLGWAGFALCSVVFGGRLLRPTAGVDLAASEAVAR
ncbi:MAG: phosphatase PAP2 family protein [Gaiellaceae bacterium]